MSSYRKISEIEADRESRIVTEAGFTAEMLSALHVPSMSPSMGLWLVTDHLEPIERALELPGLPDEVRARLVPYVKMVREIAEIAVHHQRIAMDFFHRPARTETAAGLGLSDPDHLELAEALLKLASLGKANQ